MSVWEVNYLVDKIKVAEIMTKPVRTAGPDEDVRAVAQMMLEHKIGGVPVVDDDGRLIGIVTESDIFRAFLHVLQQADEIGGVGEGESPAEAVPSGA